MTNRAEGKVGRGGREGTRTPQQLGWRLEMYEEGEEGVKEELDVQGSE